MAPLARLDFSPQPWLTTLEEASGLYKSDPQVQSLNASLRFTVTNRYFVSSEGTVVRSGDSFYQVYVGGYTQAADGMRLGSFARLPGAPVERTASERRGPVAHPPVAGNFEAAAGCAGQ